MLSLKCTNRPQLHTSVHLNYSGIYSCGQKLTLSCTEHVISTTLIFLWWNDWSTYLFVTKTINVTKPTGSKIYIQQQMIYFGDVESSVNQICFAAWPPNVLWLFMNDRSWWLIWPFLNRACLTHSLNPAEDATLEAAGTQVSVSTVKHVLHQHGLRGCHARRNPCFRGGTLRLN